MKLFWWLAPIIGILGIVGCARYPSTGVVNDAPLRTVYSEIRVNGHINPNYYYFLVFGFDQTRNTGPVPVYTGPELGNGFAVIEPSNTDQGAKPRFYVQYTNGIFTQYRLNLVTGKYEPLDLPYRFNFIYEDPEAPTLPTGVSIEVDQRFFDPFLVDAGPNPIAQLNWITMNTINPLPQDSGGIKQYDGFGPTGKDYFSQLQLTQSWFGVSGTEGIPVEPPYGPLESTTSFRDLDMIQWRIETRIRR